MTQWLPKDNLEKYTDPLKYDELYDHYKEDLNYIEEVAPQQGSTLIELACGTGRLAIPLAKKGYTIYGVDIHEGMLNLAKKKAAAAHVDIGFFHQDCTKLDLPIKSSFMFMTGNSFQHFLTNESQDELFHSVSKHMNSGGEFIFDSRNPLLTELALDEETKNHTFNLDGHEQIETNRETYCHRSQVLHCTTTIERQDQGKVIEKVNDSIKLRYTFPMELERLLKNHGFHLKALYGCWRQSAFSKDSISMIVHCVRTF